MSKQEISDVNVKVSIVVKYGKEVKNNNKAVLETVKLKKAQKSKKMLYDSITSSIRQATYLFLCKKEEYWEMLHSIAQIEFFTNMGSAGSKI